MYKKNDHSTKQTKRAMLHAFLSHEEMQDIRAMEAHQHYLDTGLHCTEEEVDAWLETWGTPEEIEAPIPHT